MAPCTSSRIGRPAMGQKIIKAFLDKQDMKFWTGQETPLPAEDGECSAEAVFQGLSSVHLDALSFSMPRSIGAIIKKYSFNPTFQIFSSKIFFFIAGTFFSYQNLGV
jgi:hypothetical protein